jgi:hypothetical protein
MAIDISASIKQLWDSCLDITAFAGVGYLCGHCVNVVIKSKPTIFGNTEITDLKGVAIFCALFMTIDRLSHSILNSIALEFNKPIYTAIRIAINLTAAVCIFNLYTSRAKLVPIVLRSASLIILPAFAAYSIAIFCLSFYNSRS